MRTLFVMLAVAACGGPEPTPELPSEGAFRMLTYNVHGLPDALSNTERPTAERMERISPLLEDYDVVGLQEDFDEVNHALLVGDTTHADERWFADRVDDSRAYGSGLTVLSRVAVVGYHEEHYTACYGVLDGASDCLASKGFQVVTLDLGGRELDVYNTHHEAGGGPEDDAARAEQVEQVIASMDAYSAGRAVLLLGDMNLGRGDPEDELLLDRYAAAGLRDACVETSCPEPDHIDQFLLRDGPELTVSALDWSREAHLVDEDGADLSDHPGISIGLSWAAPE